MLSSQSSKKLSSWLLSACEIVQCIWAKNIREKHTKIYEGMMMYADP
jgi:hypothetical protein